MKKKILVNKTKIIATIGPSSYKKSVLEDMIISGVDAVRLNFSHGEFDKHKKVIENEEAETGISIHYVSEEYDSGKIIFQKKIKVDKYDTPEKLEEKIHKLEYEYFPKVIESLLMNYE